MCFSKKVPSAVSKVVDETGYAAAFLTEVEKKITSLKDATVAAEWKKILSDAQTNNALG